MPRLTVATTVKAPLDTVWQFHEESAGFVAITPDWMRPSVRIHEGERFEEGVEFTVTLNPPLVPPIYWNGIIDRMERENGRAIMVDRLRSGPFDKWVHTHTFTDVEGGTRIVDDVRYRNPPGGPIGSICSQSVLRAVFEDRHRRLRSIFAVG